MRETNTVPKKKINKVECYHPASSTASFSFGFSEHVPTLYLTRRVQSTV